MKWRLLAHAALFFMLSACSEQAEHLEPGASLTYEVDLELVRENEWCAPGASDAEALAACAGSVRRRLAAFTPDLGLSVTTLPEDSLLTVTSATAQGRGAWTRLARGLESLGVIEFLLVLDESLAGEPGTTLAAEHARLEAWASAHPNEPLESFNRVAPGEGGPHPRVHWQAWVSDDTVVESGLERPLPQLLPATPEEWFGSGLFERVYPTPDELGRPAVGFEIAAPYQASLGEFTGAHLERQLAITRGAFVHSAPRLTGRISKGGRLAGRFSETEVRDMLAAIRTRDGPLRRLD